MTELHFNELTYFLIKQGFFFFKKERHTEKAE